MSTPQTDDIARGNHVVPTEWAKQLERERDEARELLESEKITRNHIIQRGIEMQKELREWQTLRSWGGTPEHIHGFIRGQQSRIQHLECERDEAREKIERQADIGCAFQKTNPAMCGRYKQERDEAQEKYATEATEHMLAVNKLCNERDEAREKAERYRRDANKFILQRDKAMEALMRIEDLFIDCTDIYEDFKNMGLIARAALEETK